MKETNKKRILGRYSLVIIFMLLLSGAIVYNMVKTSVVHAHAWNNKAESLLTSERPLVPERGKILSDSGTVLAANLYYYTARIDWASPAIKKDTLNKYIDALADSLHAFKADKSAEEWKTELLAQAEKRTNRSYRLAAKLSHSDLERFKNFPFLKNNKAFYSESNVKRTRPYGSMAARSIGNTRDSLIDGVVSMRGHTGLERALDSLLYGVPGVKKRIQLTSNIVDWESKPAIPGYDITTTINISLQDIVDEELYKMCVETESEWGTCILMEVATGEIKAISNLDWSDKTGDFIEGVNHAVRGIEPGSVMKPISMMVALEEGVVGDINTPIATGTHFTYYGRDINDPHGGAALTPRQIIETSSNVGMSRLIIKKYDSNPSGFVERLHTMGFFDHFNSGIGGERVPYFPMPTHNTEAHVALTRMCYGYASEIPPLYTVAMYNAIANDGKFVRPHLVKKLSRAGEPDSIVPITYVRDQVCSPENAAKLRIMLHDVVWGNRGTARKWVQDPNVEIAGKTGTAFTIDEKTNQYTNRKRLAFCGFFPYNAPKYSCIVVLCGANRGAGASSGVVLKNIALKMYARGLLDVNNDYTANPPSNRVDRPTFFASRKNSTNFLREGTGATSNRVYKTPATTQGVPDVIGLSAREAVVSMENAGFGVNINGTGHVVAQSIAAGSRENRGTVVNLTLRN